VLTDGWVGTFLAEVGDLGLSGTRAQGSNRGPQERNIYEPQVCTGKEVCVWV